MGYGITVHCKCRDKDLMLGVGLGYPMVYAETMDDIRSGKYGEEMKGLVNSGEYIAVDAEYYMYFCEGCGAVESFQALNLYEPKDAEKVGKRVTNRWSAGDAKNTMTVEEMGGLPYFNSNDEDYKLLKEYKHVCPECGKVMKKIDEEELAKKTCPKCGEKYEAFESILWD